MLNGWKQDFDQWRVQMNATFKKDNWKKISEEASLKYDQMNSAYDKLYKNTFLNRLNNYEGLKLFIDLDIIK